MANHYQCPVVALDSDYFMFNIDAGYIPINKLHWENRPITAELYMLGDFVKSFRFATSDHYLRSLLNLVLVLTLQLVLLLTWLLVLYPQCLFCLSHQHTPQFT